MRRRFIMVLSGGAAALVVLSACLMLIQTSRSGREMQAPPLELSSMAVEEPPAMAAPPPSASRNVPASPSMALIPAPPRESGAASEIAPADPIAVSVPQLAYAYRLGFRLAGPRIADAQQAHLALCRDAGPARCQLIAMRNGNSDEGYANANLQLRVASSIAQRFRDDLARTIAAAGGRAVETTITADDVSKDMVDTEARIRQREILVARLTGMLRNRQGRVAELVEAERSVAAAQEELDQAKGWLGQLRTRVAMSQFTITYTPATAIEPTPREPSGRLGDAVVASAAAVYAVGRNLLIVLIFLTPWALIFGAGVLLVRRWYSRRPPPPAEA
ncbi:DUF4349 domain-containing protein [Sphingomonas sp. HF-S4]|uniref:DUF4349 domain-containing protein n=1 Tax=Sphingomonas agrestis TaxID=3080540 RepID=A0ABU3Y6J6_9SPHN|nr:DUF4349 domain-containing protein [Sphingomonas sp. HF-S4]MDV3456926.1 DUF4349 domain-containing protein [Sphingomonas sp. HF-S4]